MSLFYQPFVETENFSTLNDKINGQSTLINQKVSVSGSQAMQGPLNITTSAVNKAAWGTSGAIFNISAKTLTDSSSVQDAKVDDNVAVGFGIPTLVAANTGVFYAEASTVFIAGAPIASTNVTITNAYALDVASGNCKITDNLTLGTLVLGAHDIINQATNITTAVTLNASAGRILCQPLPATVGLASNSFTLNNSKITTSSNIFVSVCNSTNAATLASCTTPANGSVVIKLYNISGSADTVTLSFLIL